MSESSEALLHSTAVEAMNGGIERRYGTEEKVASAGSLDDEMRVLEDCDDRRKHVLWKLETKCSENCRTGLKTCRIMHELEKMHEVATRWWPR